MVHLSQEAGAGFVGSTGPKTQNNLLEPVSRHYSALVGDFKVIFGNIYDCLIFFSWKNSKNTDKLLNKMAKMRQNRHQCTLSVISFHSGVNFFEKTIEFNNYSIVYSCTT